VRSARHESILGLASQILLMRNMDAVQSLTTGPVEASDFSG
jgi:hypothetical protein